MWKMLLIQLICWGLLSIAFWGILLRMWRKKNRKKILNPIIKEFEETIKKRGLLLVKAGFYSSSIFIKDTNDFINFAKRSQVGTIFTERDHDFINYFYIVDGYIVRTYLLRKVK